MADLPRRLRQEIVIPRNDIIYPTYAGGRVDPRDETLLEKGGGGHRAWEIYQDIAKDPHAFAILQKRYLAVVGRDWEVKAASESRADKKAAEMVEAHLRALATRSSDEENGEAAIALGGGFDQMCLELLAATLFGWSVSEIIWDQDGGEIFPAEVAKKDLRRFQFVAGDRHYKLRLLSLSNLFNGEPLPPRKFIVHRYSMGGLAQDPYGYGLGARLFFPRFFKSNSVKFWLIFADKWATPTAVGKFPRGATDAQKAELLKMLKAIATDAGVIVPETMAIEFLEAQRSSTTSTYKELVDFCNAEMSKVALGETGTTDQSSGGGSRARDEVGNEVRIEIAKADADLLSDTLNRTLVRWIVQLNLPDATPPTIWRKFPELDEKEDLNARATRDSAIVQMGFTLTRKYITETYGVELEDDEAATDPEQAPDVAGLLQPNEEEPAEEPQTEPELSEFEFAETDEDIPNRYSQQALQSADGIVHGWTDTFRDLLADSDSLETVRDRLSLLYTAMPSGEFAELMGSALIASQLAGRDEVIREGETSADLNEAIDFRGMPGATKVKQRTCSKGYSCGYSCISKGKQCRVQLAQQAAQYANHLQNQIRALQAQLAAAQAPQQPQPGTVAEVDPSTILADPKRFQYKVLGEHTKTGEVGSLSGVRKYDPNLAGVIQVWVDPADGQTYVVNGHNRLALANRLGAEKVTVRYLDVQDATEARSVGALTNIAEGRGTAIDAAKFFKDTGLSREEVEAKGIPMREKIAQDGIALAKLEDSLFRRTIDGDMPVERATIIGNSGLDHQQQRSLVAMVDQQAKRRRNITNETVRELADSVRSSAQRVETQFNLFGASQVVQDNAMERAALAANVRQRLSREKKLFATVGRSKAAEDLERAGNVIDVESSQKISREAALTLGIFDQMKNLSSPVSSALNRAADRMVAGESAKKVQDDLYREITTELPKLVGGRG
jgi:phage gp29-like protein